MQINSKTQNTAFKSKDIEELIIKHLKTTGTEPTPKNDCKLECEIKPIINAEIR